MNNELKLNYLETAFLTDEKPKEVKELFKKISNTEAMTTDIHIETDKLKPYFRKAPSYDPRYDNESIIDLKIMMLQTGFKCKQQKRRWQDLMKKSHATSLINKLIN